MPAGYATCRVARGERARLKPAVHAIGTLLAKLVKIRLPGFDRLPPCVDHAGKVIRMDSFGGVPILQFFSGLAEVIQQLTVEELHLTRRAQGAHEPGNVI